MSNPTDSLAQVVADIRGIDKWEPIPHADACEWADRIADLMRPVEVSEQVRDQADAWMAVTEVLTEVAPGWTSGNGSGMECACNTIRALTRPACGSERLRELEASWRNEAAEASKLAQANPTCDDRWHWGLADAYSAAADQLQTALASPQGAEPDYEDGCDREGFVGGCARMGCHPTATQGDAVLVSRAKLKLWRTMIDAAPCGVQADITDALSLPPGVQAAQVSDAVNRFLCWKLPKDFHPDGGISFTPVVPHPAWTHDCWPVGTNLFSADQARAMFEHCLAHPGSAAHGGEVSDG